MATRFLALAGCALALAGCMSGSDYADRAVEHNRAIAQAADEIALLNIVRAAKDRPITYSQFNGVSENFSTNIGLSLNLPFGGDAASEYNVGAETGPEQSVSLETAPLDDVDFYQGVMRPVQAGLLAYYLSNGWPPDLLLALTVEKLEVSRAFYDEVVRTSDALCRAGAAPTACGRIADPARQGTLPAADAGYLTFTNDPRSQALFDPFHNLVLRLIVLGLTVDGTFMKQELRIPATTVLATDADQLAKLIAMGARITRRGSDYVVTTASWVPGLRLKRLHDTTVRVKGDNTAAATVDLTASLRSPDSIMFYLGAYTRPGGADADVLVGRSGRERYIPVIAIAGCGDAVVQVDFEGQCYGVPRAGDHVTMKVIAFLHQVFGLNKRAVEPPAVGTVRVVN